MLSWLPPAGPGVIFADLEQRELDRNGGAEV